MKTKYLAWMCAPAFALLLSACDQAGDQQTPTTTGSAESQQPSDSSSLPAAPGQSAGGMSGDTGTTRQSAESGAVPPGEPGDSTAAGSDLQQPGTTDSDTATGTPGQEEPSTTTGEAGSGSTPTPGPGQG